MLRQIAANPWTIEAFVLRYRSAHTRRAYRCDWERFCRECGEHFAFRLTDATPDTLGIWTEDLVLAWLRLHEQLDASLDARTRAARLASRKRIVASLSAYAAYLERRRFLVNNPMSGLPSLGPGLAAHERSAALTQADMERLLRYVSEAPPGATARAQASRDLTEVVVWALLTVGMRVSELTQIRMNQLVRTAQGSDRLELSLKGGIPHDPIIHPHTAKKIRNYMTTYRQHAPPQAPLFVRAQRSAQGERPLTQYGVYRLVARALQEADIHVKVSPHGLRATLATVLVQQHIPLAHIRDLLGHQSIQTTSVYVKRATAVTESATLQLDTHLLFGYEPGDP